MIRDVLLITCEHAGNRIPREYADLFRNAKDVLATHRGYDLGAGVVARKVAAHLGCRLFEHRVSRLLADVNRSPGNAAVFSEFTRCLNPAERRTLLSAWHAPYRKQVTDWVRHHAETARVVHFSIHSFTSRLNEKTREQEIGLLYDPGRDDEEALCRKLKVRLKGHKPDWRIYMNRPYKGISDGLTAALRTELRTTRYLGIEIEINQDMLNSSYRRTAVAHLLASVLIWKGDETDESQP